MQSVNCLTVALMLCIFSLQCRSQDSINEEKRMSELFGKRETDEKRYKDHFSRMAQMYVNLIKDNVPQHKVDPLQSAVNVRALLKSFLKPRTSPTKRNFELLGKRNFELLGKRNLELLGKRNFELMGKRNYELFGKRNYELFGKRNYELFGKRNTGKRNYELFG